MSHSIAIIDARCKTMDLQQPSAQAVLIRDNRIVAVGSTKKIMQLADANTQIINAQGATVLPGFNDAHVHIFGGSVGLGQLNIDAISGFEPLRDMIAGYAGRMKDERLLIVKGCGYSVISETERLSRHHLDRIVPDRPLLVFAFDHHTAWANTMALEMAGILQGRHVGHGSEIVLGKDGSATGELREADAIAPVAALAVTGGRDMLGVVTGGEPENVTEEERQADIQVIREGLNYCASLGVTSIQNMDGNLYQLELLDEIERQGGLPVRVRMPFHMKNFMALSDLQDKAAVWKARFDTDHLRCDMVKMFMDGVTESETALLIDGYCHRPDWKGEALFPQQQFNAICEMASRLDLQIAVHAVGDGAVRMVLNGYDHACATTGKTGLRHRIEHIETVFPSDIPRFRTSGVVASMQPIHAPSGREMQKETAIEYVGPKRWPYGFAWKMLADAHVRLVFSTDWPVAPLDPLLSIQHAMTREPVAEGLPDQRLPLDEVLRAYTANGAWVEFMENTKGILREGYLADLVMLDGDIDAVASEDIVSLRVALTMCDGRITFRSQKPGNAETLRLQAGA